MPAEDQVLVIFALTRGYLDDIEIKDVKNFEKELISYIKNTRPELIASLYKTKDITVEFEKLLWAAIETFKKNFVR